MNAASNSSTGTSTRSQCPRGHGTITGELYVALRPFGWPSLEPRLIIEAIGSFDPSTPIPDFAFYRDGPPAPDEWANRPPHIAAEVLSPGQSRRDMRAKVDLYVSFGVESVWVIDPAARTVEAYEGGSRRVFAEGETITSIAVPGLRLPVVTLIERVRP
jgi:Uma2 family endonuclease